jgi:nucleoside-diphosphate-sugar epimerase
LTLPAGHAAKIVVGCGYLGHRVAVAWRQAGFRVLVTTRSAARAATLARQGLEPLVVDVTRPDTLCQLPAADTLLYAVGYDASAGVSRQDVILGGVRNLLSSTSPLSGRLIFISSTGVYGQTDGQWVDEDSPCEPRRESGRLYRDAEALVRAHPLGRQAVILRLAGLYGPGRIPHLTALQAGQRLRVATGGYLNLIHVDDAVRVVRAAESCALPNLFVVSDGMPVLRGDFYAEVARCLGVRAHFESPDPALAQVQRAASSKRVSNERLLRDLQITLQYPSYQEGVPASLAKGFFPGEAH